MEPFLHSLICRYVVTFRLTFSLRVRKSWGSTVRAVTGPRAERLRNRGSNPSREEGFSFRKPSHWLWCPSKISFKWVPGALCLGVKRSGSEAGHSAPPNVEGKMHGVISELHHTPLRRAQGQLLILSLCSLYSG
jgi:hypothetical protein